MVCFHDLSPLPHGCLSCSLHSHSLILNNLAEILCAFLMVVVVVSLLFDFSLLLAFENGYIIYGWFSDFKSNIYESTIRKKYVSLPMNLQQQEK